MILFFKRTLVFLFLSLVGYAGIFLVWTSFVPFQALKKNLNYKMGSYGSLNTRIHEADTTSNVDVLVFGSSHAYRGFDPRIFESQGIELFNLGSSNQTPKQTFHLLQKYLDQMNPRLVIYEVYPGIFEQDGLESTLDIIANISSLEELYGMIFELNHLKAYNALLYRIKMDFTGEYDSFDEPIRKPDDFDTYISGGYVQKDDTYLREQNLGDKFNWEIRDDQWRYFHQLIDLLEERNINILLVQAPVDQQFFRLGQNQIKIDSMYNQHAEYINFNEFLFFDYGKELYDLHHLNQSGVNQFNQLLIEVIKKEGYLE